MKEVGVSVGGRWQIYEDGGGGRWGIGQIYEGGVRWVRGTSLYNDHTLTYKLMNCIHITP